MYWSKRPGGKSSWGKISRQQNVLGNCLDGNVQDSGQCVQAEHTAQSPGCSPGVRLANWETVISVFFSGVFWLWDEPLVLEWMA